MDPELLSRLDALERKLDYVVERQRWTEELIEEMTPVIREGLGAASGPLAQAEARGWFALAQQLGVLADRAVAAYGPDRMHELTEHLVQIVQTAWSLTQPDVLELARDASDVIHHTSDVEPVGLGRAIRASRDAEVQRGMGVALELLRHLGRPPEASASPGERAELPRPAPPAPAGQTPRASAQAAPAAASPPEDEVVTWQGHAFTPGGFLVDPEAWSEGLAEQMAGALGIALTEEHWAVIRWARADYLEQGASPNVRRVAAGSQVGIRRMYELFPKSPGKTTAMLAGIPKPVGCV